MFLYQRVQEIRVKIFSRGNRKIASNFNGEVSKNLRYWSSLGVACWGKERDTGVLRKFGSFFLTWTPGEQWTGGGQYRYITCYVIVGCSLHHNTVTPSFLPVWFVWYIMPGIIIYIYFFPIIIYPVLYSWNYTYCRF